MPKIIFTKIRTSSVTQVQNRSCEHIFWTKVVTKELWTIVVNKIVEQELWTRVLNQSCEQDFIADSKSLYSVLTKNVIIKIQWGIRIWRICIRLLMLSSDLKKAANGASGTCGHFFSITLFWGHFESNILYFWVRIEEEKVTMDNWGWTKEIWGRRIENGRFRIQNWGWRAMNWG